MNYLAIFILVIVVIFLIQKKQVVRYGENNVSEENLEKMKYIKNNLECICTKEMSHNNVLNRIENSKAEYIFLSKSASVTESQMDLVIYNFVLSDETPCGFDALYYFEKTPKKLKNILTNLIVACMNYIQMLRKEDVYSHYFVCLKKEAISERKIKIQSFELSNELCKKVTNFRVKEFILKRNKLKLSAILNFAFVILAGTIVTANVVYNLDAVISKSASAYNVLACALIYVCYSNILGKVYSPMGRFRFIASYLFPLYIVLYVIMTAYYYIRKIVGEVSVNKKKDFLISLIILLIVYVLFILLK